MILNKTNLILSSQRKDIQYSHAAMATGYPFPSAAGKQDLSPSLQINNPRRLFSGEEPTTLDTSSFGNPQNAASVSRWGEVSSAVGLAFSAEAPSSRPYWVLVGACPDLSGVHQLLERPTAVRQHHKLTMTSLPPSLLWVCFLCSCRLADTANPFSFSPSLTSAESISSAPNSWLRPPQSQERLCILSKIRRVSLGFQ